MKSVRNQVRVEIWRNVYGQVRNALGGEVCQKVNWQVYWQVYLQVEDQVFWLVRKLTKERLNEIG